MKFYNPFEKIKELERYLNSITKDYDELVEEKVSNEAVMAQIIGRGLEWYDYKELSFSDQVAYWSDTQALLKNNVFLNEYNHFIASFIKEIAKDMNIEQIKYARFGMVAMEAFKEHLEAISSPDDGNTVTDIHEVI